MTTSDSTSLADAEQAPQFQSQAQLPVRPWRVIRIATLWLMAAGAAAFASSFVVSFVLSFSAAFAGHRLDQTWFSRPEIELMFALIGAVSCQAIFLLVAFRRGRSVGQGDLAAGLGNVAMRRRWLVAAVTILLLAFLAIGPIVRHVLMLPVNPANVAPDLTAPQPQLHPVFSLLQALLVVCLAPIGEELFFRGWLWTSLRRSWGPAATMSVTGLLWLAIHVETSLYRPLTLIPLCIAINLARHYGASVRASLVVHAANNGMVMLLAWLSILAR